MPATAACASPRSTVYRRRHPERTLLYRTVQMPLATWLICRFDLNHVGETDEIGLLHIVAGLCLVRAIDQWHFVRTGASTGQHQCETGGLCGTPQIAETGICSHLLPLHDRDLEMTMWRRSLIQVIVHRQHPQLVHVA